MEHPTDPKPLCGGYNSVEATLWLMELGKVTRRTDTLASNLWYHLDHVNNCRLRQKKEHLTDPKPLCGGHNTVKAILWLMEVEKVTRRTDTLASKHW